VSKAEWVNRRWAIQMTEADELRCKARDYHEHARTSLNPWSKCILAAIGDEYLKRANEVESPAIDSKSLDG
jgi:hypothetical protein